MPATTIPNTPHHADVAPVDRVLRALERVGPVKRFGKEYLAHCPAHNDKHASLGVREGRDGTVLVQCRSRQCKIEQIAAALNLQVSDFFALKAEFPAARPKSKKVAAYDYHDERGSLLYQTVRFEPKTFRQRRPNGRGGWVWNLNDVSKVPYRLPSLLAAPAGATVYVAEGEKDADNLVKQGLVATTNPIGACKWGWMDPAVVCRAFAGKHVIILPDNDEVGARHGRLVAENLAAIAASIRVVQLKGLKDKGDVSDWLLGHTVEELIEFCNSVAPGVPAESPGPPEDPDAQPEDGVPPECDTDGPSHTLAEDRRPTVIISTDEYRVNAEAARALAADPDLYQRGGMLVHVVEQQDGPEPDAPIRRVAGSPMVREVSPPLLRERLSRCVRWQKQTGEEPRPAHPPAWCVQAVHARSNWPAVRRLEAVVTHPALLMDGSILASNGYDPGSNLLVAMPPTLSLQVPTHPTPGDVKDAVARLGDVIVDFPFGSEAHRAAWFAGLLTPLAWFSFAGPAPMFLIDGNTRAIGKGLLADVIALIVTGRRFPVMSYTPDREELRKRITTLAVESQRIVLLDNLAGAVGNDVLDAALTADHWSDRLLGGNKRFEGPLHVAWYATGNNVQMHTDTARRVCCSRMETPEEKPELRTKFKYLNLRQHVSNNRSGLLSAAMTILRGWHVAGRPQHGLPAWGSFEGWSGVVREAVVFAGLPDPGATRVAFQSAADRDAAAMSAIIAGMRQLDPRSRGLTTASIIETLRTSQEQSESAEAEWHGDMKSAVEELCGRLDGRALGYKFRHFQRRNFGGFVLDKTNTDHGSNRWVVVAADSIRHPLQLCPPCPPCPSSPASGGDEGHGGHVRSRPEIIDKTAGFNSPAPPVSGAGADQEYF